MSLFNGMYFNKSIVCKFIMGKCIDCYGKLVEFNFTHKRIGIEVIRCVTKFRLVLIFSHILLIISKNCMIVLLINHFVKH